MFPKYGNAILQVNAAQPGIKYRDNGWMKILDISLLGRLYSNIKTNGEEMAWRSGSHELAVMMSESTKVDIWYNQWNHTQEA